MERKWWKEAVVYQIYPRSFYDSDGDGIGDLQGIIKKLDYLKELGIDVIWLCPIYKSPNTDNGYDISDYQDIMDEFGAMDDFDQLLREAHNRGMKIILDLVVNHTSDEHPWFIESRSSKDNPKRDYYIWQKPMEGREPNNWASYFSPSVWEFDKKTEEYYLHMFSIKQADLNWKNQEVRRKIYQIINWWLEKGIDGFRLDAINLIAKEEGFPDAPVKEGYKGKYVFCPDMYLNRPNTHEYIQEMNKESFAKYDVMTVGETGRVTPQDGILYTHPERKEFNMVFHFELMELGNGPNDKWDNLQWKLTDFKRIMDKWQIELNGRGWNSLYYNNHDQPRAVSRFGNDKIYWKESAKMLATLLYTLQGTPYIYQGEEIGMTNVKFDALEEYKDIDTFNFYSHATKILGLTHEKAMRAIYAKGRDNARTPMQWNQQKHAGFTEGHPWIGINPNYKEINVLNEETDENSVLNYYKKIIKLRKKYLVLVYGDYIPYLSEDEQIYCYIRRLENERILVFLNFYENEILFRLPESIKFVSKALLLSNYEVQEEESIDNVRLRPFEARIYFLNN
jgi:oligo-1,6-glucosidase